MTRARRRAVGAVLVSVLLLSGCAEGAPPRPGPEPLSLAWRQVVLPAPPGGAGRPMVRDAAVCGGRWFVVGAVGDSSGGTRPAAWTSADGVSWSVLRTDPRSFYGRQNVLSSVACRAGRVAALGAKSGGAHANPRTSSWYAAADGVLHEVRAPFVLFGGSEAVNVARMSAGPADFLISGNRISGAAVWRSVDAERFSLVERAPGLASDASGETWAFDAVAVPDGWLVVGGWLPVGRIDRDVMGWRSADGLTWRRVPAVAPAPDYEELQRVAVVDGTSVAVGVRAGSFAAWRLGAGGWELRGTLGPAGPGGFTGARSLVAQGDRLFCVTSGGDGYALWLSADLGSTWRPVSLPVGFAPSAVTSMAVSGDGRRLVLLSDDGVSGRIYLSETSE